MKLAKSILCGVAALGITAGAAVAQEEQSFPSAGVSESYDVLVLADPSSDGLVAWNDSPTEMTTYYVYDADAVIDGTPDRLVIIEGSDTLAQAPSDAELDYNSVD